MDFKIVIKEHVYMRPEVNSNQFEKSFRLHVNFTATIIEISNGFQKLFRLFGSFTAITFQIIVRFYCTCANDSF